MISSPCFLLLARSIQDKESRGPDAGSVSQGSTSDHVVQSKQISHEHQKHVAISQKKIIRQSRSKPRRRLEWPLIINGVYHGEGPLPSCRIEEDDSPKEPRAYDWPLIILHQGRSIEGADDKGVNEDSAGGKEKLEGVKMDDKSIIGSRLVDDISVER